MSSEREELIRMIWDGAVADRVRDGKDPERVPVVRPKVEALADVILAAGYSKRETVTEWAAAFPQTGNVYNYHRTREEAQAFVDGMKEVGADMVVMTREVLPQDASDWKPVGGTDPLMGILGEIVQERRKAMDVTARDLLGIAPDFTGGLSVDEYMDEQRGRGQ